MTLKRALWATVWLFLAFFIVSDPTQAADLFGCIGNRLQNVANQTAAFLAQLVR